MKVLIITAIIVGFFALLANHQYEAVTTSNKITSKNEKQKLSTYYFLVFLCAAILGSVAGLRFGVGTDFGSYYWGYPKWEMEFAQRWKDWDEPGLSTLAKLCYIVSKDGSFFIYVCAALTIVLFVFTIAKNTNDFAFSIMLYICTCWTGCFNGVRQFLAASILFAGHKLILERKFIKFCIVVFIASSVHITALIMLPMYFLITQVLDLKKIAFIMVSGVTMIYSYDFLFTILGIMKDSETGGADTNYAQRAIDPLRVVIAFAPIVLYFFFLFQKKGFTGKENFYMGFVFVRAAVVFGTSNSAYLNRAGIYFTPYLVIALSLLADKTSKKQRLLLKAIILFLYLAVWYIDDISGISWHWVWNRWAPFYNKYA